MKNTQLCIVTDRGDVIYEVEVPTCKQEYGRGWRTAKEKTVQAHGASSFSPYASQ